MFICRVFIGGVRIKRFIATLWFVFLLRVNLGICRLNLCEIVLLDTVPEIVLVDNVPEIVLFDYVPETVLFVTVPEIVLASTRPEFVIGGSSA